MRLLLLSCIVCITLSCQQQLSTSDEIFVLDEKELVEKDFLLSDFIDSMIIIPPDTSFLFKEIKEEYITSQYIILNTSEGIATYDRDGKLLYRIGNIGEGLNEYFKNPRIAINKEKSLIYVLSNKRLIIYDFTGKVISNRNINSIIDIPIQIIYQDGNLLLIGREYLSNDSQPIYKWVQMNLENYMTEHIEHGDYKLSHYDKIEGVMSKGYTLNNQARYWSVYNDTIFRIINKGYEIRYLWAKRNERYTYEDTRIPPKSRMCFIPCRICDTDRFLFVNCFNNTISGEKRTLVFDKMNKKFYNSPIIKEDIYGSNIGICFRNYHIINGREYVSATVQSDDLKNKLKQSKNSDALTLRSKIDEEGGELLILMRIKKQHHETHFISDTYLAAVTYLRHRQECKYNHQTIN